MTAVSVENSPETFGVVAALAAELIAEREQDGQQRDDFLQSLIDATVENGRPLTQTEPLGVVTVLLLGGLDTTRGALTYIGRFLAEEPGLEERLRRDWAKRDLDELLRFTSTVSVMGRLVTRDNDLLGMPLKAARPPWPSGWSAARRSSTPTPSCRRRSRSAARSGAASATRTASRACWHSPNPRSCT